MSVSSFWPSPSSGVTGTACDDALLETAAERVRAELGPALCGLIATGSRVAGTASQASDLDLIALVDANLWQRRYLRHGAVDIDLTVGSRDYFEPLLRGDANMGLLSMFATGCVVADANGTAAELVGLARATLAAGRPPINPEMIFSFRHRGWTLLQSTRQAFAHGEAAGRFTAYAAAQSLLDIYCATHRIWIGGLKDAYRSLPEQAPDLWQSIEALFDADSAESVLDALTSLAALALLPVGGIARYGATSAIALPPRVR